MQQIIIIWISPMLFNVTCCHWHKSPLNAELFSPEVHASRVHCVMTGLGLTRGERSSVRYTRHTRDTREPERQLSICREPPTLLGPAANTSFSPSLLALTANWEKITASFFTAPCGWCCSDFCASSLVFQNVNCRGIWVFSRWHVLPFGILLLGTLHRLFGCLTQSMFDMDYKLLSSRPDEML